MNIERTGRYRLFNGQTWRIVYFNDSLDVAIGLWESKDGKLHLDRARTFTILGKARNCGANRYQDIESFVH